MHLLQNRFWDDPVGRHENKVSSSKKQLMAADRGKTLCLYSDPSITRLTIQPHCLSTCVIFLYQVMMWHYFNNHVITQTNFSIFLSRQYITFTVLMYWHDLLWMLLCNDMIMISFTSISCNVMMWHDIISSTFLSCNGITVKIVLWNHSRVFLKMVSWWNEFFINFQNYIINKLFNFTVHSVHIVQKNR